MAMTWSGLSNIGQQLLYLCACWNSKIVNKKKASNYLRLGLTELNVALKLTSLLEHLKTTPNAKHVRGKHECYSPYIRIRTCVLRRQNHAWTSFHKMWKRFQFGRLPNVDHQRQVDLKILYLNKHCTLKARYVSISEFSDTHRLF